MTFGNRSNKSLKRQSISNLSSNNLRRESVQKPGRTSVINSNSVAVLENKENVPKDENVVVQMDVNVNGGQGGDYSKELEGLHVDVNTLNLCYDELKLLVQELRKRDAKHHAAMIEVQDKQKRMQDEMRKDSQNFDKQLKNIQISMLNNNNNQKDKEEEKEEKNEGKKSPKRGDRTREPREPR